MPRDYPEPVVDAHAHMFNARYLPLKGVLENMGVPGFLAQAARRLFNLLAGKADFPVRAEESFSAFVLRTDDLGQLAEALTTAAVRTMATRATVGGLLSLRAGSPREGEDAVMALRTDELYAVLEEIEGLYLSEQGRDVQDYQRAEVHAAVAALAEAALTESEELERTRHWLFGRFERALSWLLTQLLAAIRGDAYASALDYVKFLLLMLSSEAALRESLLSGYRPEQNVGLVLHLMMDMQKAYSNEEPYYPFYKKQIKRMADLVDGSGGRVVGLVAFDPRRSDGLKIVKYGLACGNCGVKIYPPMGYLPFGSNPDQTARFRELYRYCCAERIPVLTHCTAVGFEARKGFGPLSDPDNWTPVLQEYGNLILCYGHAGGGGARNRTPDDEEEVCFPGWFAKDDAEWLDERNFARKVVAHCLEYPHVYCDFSYFHEMLADDSKACSFKRHFVDAYQDDGHPYHFADKAMFGSDWHMPSMAWRTADYLDFFIEIFEHPVLKPHRDKFFHKNALRFLKLESFLNRLLERNPALLSPETSASLEATARSAG